MSKAPPKSLVPHWWRRALQDGTHCENKRREKWFREYLEEAESDLEAAGLIPESFSGIFRLLYRRGFKLAYDNALLLRQREKTFLPRRRKKPILRL